ncbi:hypothetical protein CWI42_050340 [Ordospora colligata]|uniref:Uncharacterized protein n=1 Tax=Ordospora colligata OC4 TaxID=1354746 RepID=A0A0B2UEX7_9MICR|nr:uncharacterized protein M896_050370 [Ordospora colligata OC4]KHN69631.1 hypothetical protein M896_050370 [Ordospora colligata OC4]TBU15750.1 hypothetical protein CWI41_050360 [Ordospora colligata]TBU15878.1 hypothetical protein CWI40_050380 [Ordospora colligata]TBU18772.1 hypothetical protein CWI42_050340 [Ordospora colligata]
MTRDENKLIFEGAGDLNNERIIEVERMIKRKIRQYSLNLQVENVFERYSDKYFVSLLTEDMLKSSVSLELMPSEISKVFGAKRERKVEDIGSVESSSSEEAIDDESESKSEESDNDYVQNFYDEEELVSDKEEEGYIF